MNVTLFRLGWMAALAVTFLYTANQLLTTFGEGNFGVQPLLVGWVFVLGIATLVAFNAEPGQRHPTTHGSARWAARDIRGLVRRRGAPLEPGSIALAPFGWFPKVVLPLALAQLHVLLLGPTGSGKSRGLIMVNIQRALGSPVATDPKDELWAMSSGYHARPLRYAPCQPDAVSPSTGYRCAANERLAQLLAAAVMQLEEKTREEPFWALLSGYGNPGYGVPR